jgi:small nuclear ribonucleoprotein (snRNP)-like protein
VHNSFFKTLVDHEVTVELKNDIQIRGTLKSVDQYLNIKLDDIQVVEELKYPHLVSQRRGRHGIRCETLYILDRANKIMVSPQ